MSYKILSRNFLITLFDHPVKRKKPESQHVVFHTLSTLCAIDIGRPLRSRFRARSFAAPPWRETVRRSERITGKFRRRFDLLDLADAQNMKAK